MSLHKRALKSIEDYIRKEVLPLYGNTHSSVTVTAEQTTLFTYEAKDLIRNAVRASDRDAVLLCGSGVTGAVSKLIHLLKFEQAPVVIVGPFEHHSNLLPWRELAHKILVVKEDCFGLVDLVDLENKLQEVVNTCGGRTVLGCFTAASNITGVLSDTVRITETLHRFGALAFWDFAAAAPYVDINVNPVPSDGQREGAACMDAIYFSGHKFIGGVETPGVLVVKKRLINNRVPSAPGGGSVFFVRRETQCYLKEDEFREESGTPNIVGVIRLGLAFHLKNSLTPAFIMRREEELSKLVSAELESVPNVELLGPSSVPRLCTFSFLIRHRASGLYLHHNFVCALLDNVFGIQCRAGCMCAGPYALELLGVDERLARDFEEILREDSGLDRDLLKRGREYSDREILRPGLVRLGIPYFFTKNDINFALGAIRWVSEHGWKLLPQYQMNHETGEWHHRDLTTFKYRKWLSFVSFGENGLRYRLPAVPQRAAPTPESYEECLARADVLAGEVSHRISLPDDTILFSSKTSKLRWFLLASEANYFLGQHASSKIPPAVDPPFTPKKYLDKVPDSVFQEILACFGSGSTINEKLETALETSDKQRQSDFSNGYCSEVCPESIAIDPVNSTNSADCGTSSHPSTSKCNGTEIEDCCGTTESTVDVKNWRRQNWNERRIVVTRKDVGHSVTKYKWHPPPASIFKRMLTAMEEYQMIGDGDRVLVCLSGGKDSLSLLHSMHQYQYYARSQGIRFDLGAVTVDPGSTSYDPSSLIQYLKGLNLTYLYEEQRILDLAMSMEQVESICSFCSRMKRGRLYAAARKFGYNVLAFGQHLDDLAESFLMSFFHNGTLRTMKAHYTVREGDIRVIRPLAYVRERELRNFAHSACLPVIPENCPACFHAPKERHRIKQLLAAQELLFPSVFVSIKAAIRPLLSVTAVDQEEAVKEAVTNIQKGYCNTACGDFEDVGSE